MFGTGARSMFGDQCPPRKPYGYKFSSSRRLGAPRSRRGPPSVSEAGCTAEVLRRLGRVQGLAVTSRNAVQSFRGRAAKAPSVLGDSLRVAYLVSGNVRRGGTRLRITVELVRTAGGARVWGDAFDREDADVLALEED